MVMPQDRKQLANRVQSYLEGREPAYTHHFRMQTSDGGWRWIYAQGQVTIRDAKGRPLGMHGIHQDIQEIQDRQKQLEESEERFKAYTENAPVGIFIVKDFHFIYANPEATRLTGYSQEELGKIKLLGIIHPEDRHELVREVRTIIKRQILNSQYTYRIVGKSGDIHWVEVRVSLLERADPTFLLSVIDVTARKDAEDRLKEYATFDELTGVYNRRVGITLLEQEIHHTKRERSAFTICFVDVNGLKTVNDTWGHDEGDALIKTVVDIIQSKLRRGDILCRLGGDEFLMMFKNCTLENAGRIWDRIEKKIDMVNKLTEKPYMISVSYGLLEHNHTMEKTVTELINMADQKMYDDKKAKRAAQVQRD
jgi:diguanylate cyclase (GGDEF)-like protein/PAS domain S-box-containing protein